MQKNAKRPFFPCKRSLKVKQSRPNRASAHTDAVLVKHNIIFKIKYIQAYAETHSHR